MAQAVRLETIDHDSAMDDTADAVKVISQSNSGVDIGDVDIASQISALLDSTVTALGDGATYTGDSKACDKYARIVGSIYTDHASTLYIDQSQDGTNWDYYSDFAVTASTGLAFSAEVVAPYCRMRVVNSAGAAQTALRSYARGRVV
jgi:hypothetical protein